MPNSAIAGQVREARPAPASPASTLRTWRERSMPPKCPLPGNTVPVSWIYRDLNGNCPLFRRPAGVNRGIQPSNGGPYSRTDSSL